MSAEYNRFTSNSLEYAVDLVNVGVKTPHQLPNPLLTILKTPKHTALQAGGRGFESLIAHNQNSKKAIHESGWLFSFSTSSEVYFGETGGNEKSQSLLRSGWLSFSF